MRLAMACGNAVAATYGCHSLDHWHQAARLAHCDAHLQEGKDKETSTNLQGCAHCDSLCTRFVHAACSDSCAKWTLDTISSGACGAARSSGGYMPDTQPRTRRAARRCAARLPPRGPAAR